MHSVLGLFVVCVSGNRVNGWHPGSVRGTVISHQFATFRNPVPLPSLVR